jgi:hypothetical protein
MCLLSVLSYFFNDNGYRSGGLPATMPRITGPCCNISEKSSINLRCERIAKRNGTGNLIISGALHVFNRFSCFKLIIDVLPMLSTWRRKL